MLATREAPKIRNLMGHYLAMATGRHKVYASLYHPLKNRVAYAAQQAKLPVPEVQMLPEDQFWPMVEQAALTKSQTVLDTLFELADLRPDCTWQPAHPFLAG